MKSSSPLVFSASIRFGLPCLFISSMDISDRCHARYFWLERHSGFGKLLRSLTKKAVKKVPLGVRKDLQNFMECQHEGQNETVEILGVVGLGGSGKATLTEQMYALQPSIFDSSRPHCVGRYRSPESNGRSIDERRPENQTEKLSDRAHLGCLETLEAHCQSFNGWALVVLENIKGLGQAAKCV